MNDPVIPAPPWDYAGAYAYLLSRRGFSIKLGLENIQRLMQLTGHPEAAFPTVHVAGTNGKGSICALLAAALGRTGLRTGLFTSPHLVNPRERVRIDGAPIREADFADELASVYHHADLAHEPDDFHPSFFELMTTLGFCYFRRQAVDMAVIEVGMGGRLDATNVVTPEVSVITPIDYDHQVALGPTLGSIAGEKAGIIKPGVPVVCASESPEAVAKLRAVAEERGAPFRLINHDFELLDARWEGPAETGVQRCRVRVGEREQTWATALPGRHQGRNLATAVAALHELQALGWDLPDARLAAGLQQARWPGRLQFLPDGTLVDATHNLAGLRCTLEALDEMCPDRRFALLFGTLRDKPWRDILTLLRPRLDSVHVCPVDNWRAEPVGGVLDYLQLRWPELPTALVPDVRTGLGAIREAGNGLVLGSLYLAGAALAHSTDGEPVAILA